MTNHLSGALTITTVNASTGIQRGDNTCGTSIAAGASCTIGVTFSPTAVGSATGTLTFNDSAITTPQNGEFVGTGIAPVTLSVSSLSFSTTVAGNTSAAKTVTLTNNLAVALSITSTRRAARSPWLATRAARASRQEELYVGVTFSPTAVGSASGTLTFTDSAGTSPQTVSLSEPAAPR